MDVAVAGLSHRTASLDVLERAARRICLPPDGAMLLSTCARVEVWGTRHVVAAIRGWPQEPYVLSGADGVRHLFRVACGLDSLVAGEREVAGQLRRARTAAGPGLDLARAVDGALGASRRFHGGREGAPSVAHAALSPAGDLHGRRLLVVGAGRIGAAVAHAALRRGAHVKVANRSPRLAGPPCHHLRDLPALLAWCDVVVAATSSTRWLIDADMLAAAAPVVAVDMGLPRNIEPGPHVLDLSAFGTSGAGDAAEAFVAREAEAFLARPRAEAC